MKCCCWRLLLSVLYSARIPTGLRALAWRLSCGCTKALSHPEAPMCQYQEGQCVRAGRSIVVCVCLAWLSPFLSAETNYRAGRQCYQSTASPVFLSLWLPLWVRLLAPTQNTNQLSSTSIFSAAYCRHHCSQRTCPSSLSPVSLSVFCLME